MPAGTLGIGIGILGGYSVAHCSEHGVGSYRVNSGCDSREHLEPFVTPRVWRVRLGTKGQRHPHLCGGIREVEIGRHHGDDLIRLGLELNRAPEDSRIGVELGSPQRIAQEGDFRRAVAVAVGQNCPSKLRLNSEHREKTRRGIHRVDVLRISRTAQAAHREIVEVIGSGLAEDLAMRSQL